MWSTVVATDVVWVGSASVTAIEFGLTCVWI